MFLRAHVYTSRSSVLIHIISCQTIPPNIPPRGDGHPPLFVGIIRTNSGTLELREATRYRGSRSIATGAHRCYGYK